MTQRFEGQFTGAKGALLFYQTWQIENPRGTIVVTHGLAEHSECYSAFADVLNQFHWNVIGWDLRGHGRSEGKRGYVEDFDDFVNDFTLLYQGVVKKLCHSQRPVLFGHSLGGLITLKTLLLHEDIQSLAVATSAPALGVAVQVPSWKIQAAKLAAKWMPTLTMWNEIRYSQLTRDEQHRKTYGADPLRHDKVSPRLYLGLLESQRFVQEHAAEFKLPLLLQLAGADAIADTNAALLFFQKVASDLKAVHVYNDSYHDICNDLDRDGFYQDLKNFLNQFNDNMGKSQCHTNP